jgi:hypothetical protein
LPAIDRVALLDTTRSGARPSFVAVGDKPVAVTGVGDTAYVAIHGAKRVVALDARTGRRIRAAGLAVLGSPRPRPTVLRRVRVRPLAERTVLTLALAGSGLDRTGVVVRDGRPADGSATLELWQGAIATASRVRTFADVTVRIARAPGRLTVRLSASAGTFTAMHVRRPSGTSIVIELTRRPSTPPPPRTFSPQPPVSTPTGPAPSPPPPSGGQTTTTTPDCCITG